MNKVMARLENGRVKDGCMTHDPTCSHGNGFKPPLSMIDADKVEDDIERCGFCGGGARVHTGKLRHDTRPLLSAEDLKGLK